MGDGLEPDVAERGATAVRFEGIAVAAHFGDPGREWRAAREGAAVFPATYRRCLAAVGDDRAGFLHGMLTNDVKGLAVGSGCHAAFLDARAHVVTDVRVYATAEALVLDVMAWRAALLRERLEHFLIADDVELREALDCQPLVQVEGPLATAVVGEVLGVALEPAARFSHQSLSWGGLEIGLVRASEIGEQGLLVLGPAAARAGLLDACREAGAVLAGMQTLDGLRIEAGVPWPGIDMDERTLIMEIGVADMISATKGCYLGQEVVERVSARGHVNRTLCGLVLSGAELPAHGTPLLIEQREVGYVTSAAHSPLLDGVIALAIISRKFGVPGTSVGVGVEQRPATVAVLPVTSGTPRQGGAVRDDAIG